MARTLSDLGGYLVVATIISIMVAGNVWLWISLIRWVAGRCA